VKAVGLALVALLLTVGCAKIWGFDDLRSSPGAGGSGAGFPGTSGAAGSSCVPDYRLCTDRCGEIVDNCGTVSQCGSCYSPQSCGGGDVPNTCSEKPCVPSCEGQRCGQSNGCDGICGHGECPEGKYCSGSTCVPVDTCAVSAPCPENDCASCGLYCSAEGRCCEQSYGCTANADCCQGKYCDRDKGETVGTCRNADGGQRCSDEISCSFVGGAEAGTCEEGKCCYLLGSWCSGNETCCAGLQCADEKCCVPSQQPCAATTECCGAANTCQGGVCCIASGSPGCTSNADCCEGSPGCVAGSCK
jgi:hypothetical protein